MTLSTHYEVNPYFHEKGDYDMIITVIRNISPSMDRSCSSGLNGSNPEQIIHNKVGRLLLDTTDTWNIIFDGLMWIFTYGETSPRRYL